MGAFSEVGHNKNVANFEDLISFCTAYGTSYNPSNSNITLAGMQAINTAALANIQALNTAKTALDNTTNAREILFKDFQKLATRVMNALKAVSAAPQTIKDAQTINNKIQGKRAGGSKKTKEVAPPVLPDANTPQENTTISVSHRSFDSSLENFARLIEIVTQEPLYTPNEAELSVTGLNTLLTTMQGSNTAVINATTTYQNALLARNKTLYDPKNGLVTAAADVKKYLKSVFGTQSPEYKQVSKLVFVRYKI